MPSLTFVMPHWLYWAGLLLFPAIAIYLVRRQIRQPMDRRPSLFIAYLFWLTAGFLGIHRFYLRSAWGYAFLPLFILLLYCNAEVRDLRDNVSRTFAARQQAETTIEQARTEGATTAEEKQELKADQGAVTSSEREYQIAKAASDEWKRNASIAAGGIALLLLADAVLIPGLVRRRRALELAQPDLEVVHAEAPVVHEAGTAEDPTMTMHTRFTDAIEWLNVRVGEYVAYWAVIAVFVYYYEVVARFLFNSPTNWVHESMFLMFGMQYMLCGAFAYREDQHVRVDVVYAKFSRRGKAIADIITSVFFFIFIGTMLWTGARFAMDAVSVGESSFTEWGIQYWPVKLTIPIGAALMLLQGISKLIKDILIVTRKGA